MQGGRRCPHRRQMFADCSSCRASRISMPLPAASQASTVPSNALLFRQEGLRVGVVRDGRVQLVPINIGHDYGNTVEVTAGLSPGDQVVVNPSDSLVTGTRVEINTNTRTGPPEGDGTNASL